MTETGPIPPHRYAQPWLHDLEICVRGNVTALGDANGDLGAPGTGVWVDDRRVLSRLALSVAGEQPVRLVSTSRAEATEVVAALRGLGDPGPDLTVVLRRTRHLIDAGMHERLTVTNRSGQRVSGLLLLEIEADGADIADVKAGRPPRTTLPMTYAEGALQWADARHRSTLTLDNGQPAERPHGADWTWELDLPPGEEATLTLDLSTEAIEQTPFPARWGGASVEWSTVSVACDDRRVEPLVRHSLDDLRGLLLTDPESPQDVFAAAGTPWYLTLFGRDSLWAARLMLPFGTDLARGTLRSLARRQGTATDAVTASGPGKILHEVRRTTYVDPVTGMTLPPIYYGSVDATPLWVRLLHDAWRWGLDEQVVRELEPTLRRALEWMRAEAEGGDGLLRYVDESGSGLANQGWKDSGDSMRRSDGTIAEAPIALVETQAYAVAAARGAADLLETVLGESGDAWRTWADDLTATVRDRFWVDSPSVRHLSMAIAGDGSPVDGVGSNMGHVLGTGVLSAAEARRTAHALTSPDMLGPAGVRTLSRDNPAYNPVGYHTGSVWTHDNAVAALGLAQEGFADEAARVLGALVDVGSWTGNRWPELFGGELLMGRPLPYPASCRPQAWAAASAGALVEVVLGLSADAPNRTLRLAPISPAPFGAMTVRGIRLGDVEVTVSVGNDGEVVDVQAPGLEVVVG